MRRPVLASLCAVPALALAACAADAPLDPTEAFEPYALELEVVDADLAAEAAAVDASVYVAAPLLTAETQAVLELTPDLRPLAVVDVSGAGIAAISATSGTLTGLSRACLSDNQGYAFCSRLATLTADGIEVDESTAELDLDFHALVMDPDGGGFWADRYAPVDCTEEAAAGACGLAPEDEPLERVYDCQVVHVREGEAVWEWSALAHVDQATLDAAAATSVYNPVDPFHCNSVQVDHDTGTVYVSMRHPSSVFAIDSASGEVLWTFGVDPAGPALEVADPEGLLGARQVLSGNHDFRWLGGDRFSVFDNGSGEIGTARAVIFAVAGGTATVESVIEDPAGRTSRCTGSARPVGEDEEFWLVSWGCSESGVSLMTADGRPVAHLTVDWEGAVERGMLTEIASEQADLGHTVTYHAVVAQTGLLR